MAVQSSDLFILERAGAMYHTLASDLLAYVQANVGTTQYEATDIAARNALSGLSYGDLVFVVDASADATVTSGWAIYQYIGSGWRKIAEEESVDINLQVDLNAIATPTNITVESSAGNNAVLNLANATNAGLLSPANYTKLANIIQTGMVDLDTMSANSHAPANLAGTTNTNPLTISGQTLGFSISQLTEAP